MAQVEQQKQQEEIDAELQRLYGEVEKVKLGMQKELTSYMDFGVFDDIDYSTSSPAEKQGMLRGMWLKAPKNLDVDSGTFREVRCRCVACGSSGFIHDSADAYASTPLPALVVLLTLGLAGNCYSMLGDMSTAFLHASLRLAGTGTTDLLWPPQKF